MALFDSFSVCGTNHFWVKKIRKLFQSISCSYQQRFFSTFQSFHFSSSLKLDETVKQCLRGLYLILYVDLSSPLAQKYFTSSSFSFQSSSVNFLINLLSFHVTQLTGKDKLLVHSLLFKLSLKVLKSVLSGFGNNRILFSSLEIPFKSSKKLWFILKSLYCHSILSLNFNSHHDIFHLNVPFAILMSHNLIFIHWYHHPGSSLSQTGNRISDQFSNFPGQSFSISSLNFSGVKGSVSLLSLDSAFSGGFM
jgi:hypothetical protein